MPRARCLELIGLKGLSMNRYGHTLLSGCAQDIVMLNLWFLVPQAQGEDGNPVRIRDCPAAVSRNEHPQWHWPANIVRKLG